ncbi:MAG: di-trans,poly-cis-decaprenylcistransferase [Candidatus Andersenbacteria bacterium]|nr:di-trans,poly-cis-decaprenylcistransferase [Candidatus Andersenbacteria bacterium]MBI3251063.1 di-trans,poly-cis-decaprenylcistransferase [Candidatus Andersenbacteria bacterium]
MNAIPRHVAIIPDGNRRWAKGQGLSAFDGHQKGVDIFRDVVNHAADKGVRAISLWGMSIDNFVKRSPLEIKGLVNIFQKEFERMLTDSDIHERKMRVRVFGRWQEKFPRKLRSAIEAVEEATAKYSNYAMNLFLAYNGTDEMIQAVQKIVESGQKKITSSVIKEHLFTKDLPSVDLLIRTGGEPHLSAGFMMWDVADSELYFTDTYWPAFTTNEFDIALSEYATRRRKHGK